MTNLPSSKSAISPTTFSCRCAVPGCKQPPVAEIVAWDYDRAFKVIYNIPYTTRKKAAGSPPICICARHVEDPRFTSLRWQWTLAI